MADLLQTQSAKWRKHGIDFILDSTD